MNTLAKVRVLCVAVISMLTTIAAIAIQPPTGVTTMKINPTTVAGGVASAGTVYLTAAAPTGGVTINLSSDKTSATVPATISVAAGAKYGTFSITTATVASDTTATITAELNGTTATGTITYTAPALTQIKLGPGTVNGSVGTFGTVYLSGFAPTGGITVNLSSDLSFATVPSTVTINAGTKYTSFAISTVAVPADSVATISAVTTGSPVTVPLNVLAPVVNKLKINPATVNGGGTSPATVYISANAPTGGMTINLSSNVSFLSVPTTVTIPAGSKYTTFVVTSSAVPADTSGTITASLAGNSVTYDLLVYAPVLTSVKLGPATIFGGFATAGTVILNANAPTGGIEVFLDCDLDLIGVPVSVIIPEGSKYTTFDVFSNTVDTLTTSTITASLNGISKTVDINLKPTDLAGIKFVYPNVFGGNQMQGKVVLQGYAPYPTGAVVHLSSDNPMVVVPATVTIDGFTIQSFFNVQAKLVNTPTTATITVTYGTSTANTTVTVLPAWPVVGGNQRGTFMGIGAGATANIQWTTNVGTVPSSPTIGPDGTIYLTSVESGKCQAINPDGTVKWSVTIPDGPSSEAAIGQDGHLYVGSTTGILWALNSADGSTIWECDFCLEPMLTPAIGQDGTVYATSADGDFGAISPDDGYIYWSIGLGDPFGSIPVFADDGTVLLAAGFGDFFAFDYYYGDVLWHHAGGDAAGVVIDGNKLYIPSGSILFRVDNCGCNDGFNIDLGETINAISVGADGTIYCSTDAGIHAIDPLTAAVKWTVTDSTSHFDDDLGMTVTDYALFRTAAVIGADGTLYAGDTFGNVLAINPSDGSTTWSVSTGSGIITALALGIDGTVYVTSTGGTLIAIR